MVQTESEWIPVADATVVCILPDGSQQKVKTDTKGRYMFSDLWEGRYRILIVAENYKEKEYEFSLQENLLINAALMPEGTVPEGFCMIIRIMPLWLLLRLLIPIWQIPPCIIMVWRILKDITGWKIFRMECIPAGLLVWDMNRRSSGIIPVRQTG